MVARSMAAAIAGSPAPHAPQKAAPSRTAAPQDQQLGALASTTLTSSVYPDDARAGNGTGPSAMSGRPLASAGGSG